MKRDVQGIPPAPRRVRWSKVLAYRWPLAAAALVLCGYFGMLTWLLFLARGENNDALLDEGPIATATARIVRVSTDEDLQHHPAERVAYEFDHRRPGSSETQHHANVSFAPVGRWQPGAEAQVELLPDQPHVSRLLGGRANLVLPVFAPHYWLFAVVVPGAVLLLYWLFGVLHLRHILTRGVVGVATPKQVRRVRGCLPEMWSVQFVFRDHRAQEREGRHWVRAHSPLGDRLRRITQGSGERMAVLHDRRWPRFCRLVLPDDFAPDPRPQGHPTSLQP